MRELSLKMANVERFGLMPCRAIRQQIGITSSTAQSPPVTLLSPSPLIIRASPTSPSPIISSPFHHHILPSLSHSKHSVHHQFIFSFISNNHILIKPLTHARSRFSFITSVMTLTQPNDLISISNAKILLLRINRSSLNSEFEASTKKGCQKRKH